MSNKFWSIGITVKFVLWVVVTIFNKFKFGSYFICNDFRGKSEIGTVDGLFIIILAKMGRTREFVEEGLRLCKNTLLVK